MINFHTGQVEKCSARECWWKDYPYRSSTEQSGLLKNLRLSILSESQTVQSTDISRLDESFLLYNLLSSYRASLLISPNSRYPIEFRSLLLQITMMTYRFIVFTNIYVHMHKFAFPSFSDPCRMSCTQKLQRLVLFLTLIHIYASFPEPTISILWITLCSFQKI